MLRKGWEQAKSIAPLLVLLLLVSVSFWLAPAPQGQSNVDYWGHYQRLGPGLGFVVNHDSYGYLKVAENPRLLLQPREVRQSRPLYPLLGAAVGYPLAGLLQLGGRLGLLPPLPPEHLIYYGLYGGYVLLNGVVMVLILWLLRRLTLVLAPGAPGSWPFYPLAWVLLANPVTKAFFWTAHQQMFTFLVPLLCLALASWLRQRPALGWARLSGLALGLGVLPLVYGSFVLLWPALAFGRWRPMGQEGGRGMNHSLFGQLLVSALLFALPTLLWIGLLRLHGTTYYNYEADRFHQLVWLWEARQLPVAAFAALVAGKLGEYLSSLHLLWGWLLIGAGLYLATRRRVAGSGPLLPPVAGAALAWVTGCFVGFFALLGYYPERLAYTLLPLLLCLLAAMLPRWPRRYAQPLALAVAGGWHLYVLLSYGPFS